MVVFEGFIEKLYICVIYQLTRVLAINAMILSDLCRFWTFWLLYWATVQIDLLFHSLGI